MLGGELFRRRIAPVNHEAWDRESRDHGNLDTGIDGGAHSPNHARASPRRDPMAAQGAPVFTTDVAPAMRLARPSLRAVLEGFYAGGMSDTFSREARLTPAILRARLDWPNKRGRRGTH